MTYIDVGAGHPKEHSNTYLFYEQGVTGICVDPNYLTKEFRQIFEITRPKDVLVNSPIGEDGKLVNFYYYDPYVYSTTSDKRHSELVSQDFPRFKRSEVLKSVSLRSLTVTGGSFLSSKEGQTKHYFLSVDVEAQEYSVIKSIDFATSRPVIIVCEVSGLIKAGSIFKTPVHQLLMGEDYRLKAVTDSNFFYVDVRRSPFDKNKSLPFNS